MIIYAKLGHILEQRGMKWKDLCDAGISANTPQSFSKNRNLNTSNIDKVCAFLKVQPGDIMEWVESEDQMEILELQRQKQAIEAKISQLQEKSKEE